VLKLTTFRKNGPWWLSSEDQYWPVFILVKSTIFYAMGLEGLKPGLCIQNFSFCFRSVSARPSGIMVNISSHQWLLPLTCRVSYRQVLLSSDGRLVVVDPFAEVCSFSYMHCLWQTLVLHLRSFLRSCALENLYQKGLVSCNQTLGYLRKSPPAESLVKPRDNDCNVKTRFCQDSGKIIWLVDLKHTSKMTAEIEIRLNLSFNQLTCIKKGCNLKGEYSLNF
jgi:hypothetical protein